MAWNEKALKLSNKKAKLDELDLEAEREADAMKKAKELKPKTSFDTSSNDRDREQP